MDTNMNPFMLQKCTEVANLVYKSDISLCEVCEQKDTGLVFYHCLVGGIGVRGSLLGIVWANKYAIIPGWVVDNDLNALVDRIQRKGDNLFIQFDNDYIRLEELNEKFYAKEGKVNGQPEE